MNSNRLYYVTSSTETNFGLIRIMEFRKIKYFTILYAIAPENSNVYLGPPLKSMQ